MRLLEYNNDGGFSPTEFFESDIPKYAILSHRWGTEEVTFKYLLDGMSKNKASYGKIQFCGEQARRDGLQYFWVDTCCIDKSDVIQECKTDLIPLKGWFIIEAFIMLWSEVITNYM
jgi:hypothetical protein